MTLTENHGQRAGPHLIPIDHHARLDAHHAKRVCPTRRWTARPGDRSHAGQEHQSGSNENPHEVRWNFLSRRNPRRDDRLGSAMDQKLGGVAWQQPIWRNGGQNPERLPEVGVSISRNCRRTRKGPPKGSFSYEKSGGVLLSQGVSSQVPSALVGLTSVFGMGTGVTPPP